MVSNGIRLWLGLAVLLAMLTPACDVTDRDVTNGGGGGGALSACEANCEGESTGCDAKTVSDFAKSCKQLCAIAMPLLSADCKKTAESYFSCNKAAKYECGPGSTLPVKDTLEACAELFSAYARCGPSSLEDGSPRDPGF